MTMQQVYSCANIVTKDCLKHVVMRETSNGVAPSLASTIGAAIATVYCVSGPPAV